MIYDNTIKIEMSHYQRQIYGPYLVDTLRNFFKIFLKFF
jgi:hypothetical protein